MSQFGPMIVRDPVEYLRSFLSERARPRLRWRACEKPLGPHDVAYILKTIAREILPAAGLRGRCAQLDLFTDWTVHGEIDRSSAGQAAIAKVAEAIPLHGQDGRDNKWFEEQVNDAVSFAALRLDLVAVCRQFQLPDAIFTTWDAWQRFALPLSFEVSGRPIRLGQRGHASTEAKRRIETTPLEPHHRPDALVLCLGDKGKRLWRVEAAGNAIIVLQVLFGGFRPSDFPVPDGWRSPLEAGVSPAEQVGP